MTEVRFKRDIDSLDIPLPEYATEGAAGADIRASADAVLAPGEYRAIPTGLCIEMPQNVECQVRPRSGIAAKHGVTVLNAPGTIDSDYRGEIKVLLINHGSEPFVIRRGDRIAQLVFAEVLRVKLVSSKELSSTERADGGFGHSGTR